MNKQVFSIIAVLLIFLLGSIWVFTGTDKMAKPQPAPASANPLPATSNEHKASETTIAEQASISEPITGAFGIPLGEPFQPSMVAKVISEQEQTYTGPNDIKLKGTLYRVEPRNPDKRFQQYSLKTTDKGIIYTVQGDYQYKKQDETSLAPEIQEKTRQLETKTDSDSQNKVKADETKPKGKGKGLGKPGNKQQAKAIQASCKAAVKTMAKELEARHGKPRGQGWDGLWFAFRQFSDSSNLSLRLYGHRCRTGMYSIIYTDIKLQRGIVPVKAKLSPKVKTPPADPVDTDKVPARPAPETVPDSQTNSGTGTK